MEAETQAGKSYSRRPQMPNLSCLFNFRSSNSVNLPWVIVVVFYFFFIFTTPVRSDPRITEAGLFCGNATPPGNSSFIPTFVKEMEVLSQLIANYRWGQFIANSTSNTSSNFSVYGLAQCYQDLSHTDCLLCFAVSRTRLPHCLPSAAASIFLDGCFLRYDNYDFFNESTDLIQDRVNCSGSGTVNGEARLEFKKSVAQLLDILTELAVSNGGFGVREAKGVFGLAQCWESVSSEGCRECLEKAANEVKGCLPRKEGRGMNAGCYLRYSTTKFFNDGAESLNGSSGSSTTGPIAVIALAAAAFLMFSLFAGYACYVRWSRSKQVGNNLDQVSTSFNRSGLNFKYEVLEKATDYFNSSWKIGQGGAGSVFKGTLPNGETVAVKRLFFNTRQWVDEFFNEVNLVSGIEHKNLVKLLGCSIEGPESLLVYEYVPNRSLDQSLFDENGQGLSWKQRFNIIVGTAEGLAYLHGGTETRIIHRDIKSSNILLDKNLDPKIADFGLARCFAADKSHLSTGIAGTLGYMAPEYLIRGQLTEKADVYSFGVLVIEIICGRKSNTLIEDSGSLIQTVWKLYKANRLVEFIDPRLKDGFPAEEASNVLQIGLLCIQASVTLRPSMAEVVQMLSNLGDGEIPEPDQPPFMNASALKPAGYSSNGTYSMNSLVSKAVTKIEGSSSSTERSSLLSSERRSEK